MKKLIFALMILLTCAGLVHADPTVVADPKGAYGDIKNFVNRIDPAIESLLSVKDLEFFNGVSGSVYKYAPNDIELVDFRAGFALDKIGYGSFPVNIANLGRKYLPESFNNLFDSVPTPIRGVFAKYSHIGGWVGYDFEDTAVDGGVTFGLTVPLP